MSTSRGLELQQIDLSLWNATTACMSQMTDRMDTSAENGQCVSNTDWDTIQCDNSTPTWRVWQWSHANIDDNDVRLESSMGCFSIQDESWILTDSSWNMSRTWCRYQCELLHAPFMALQNGQSGSFAGTGSNKKRCCRYFMHGTVHMFAGSSCLCNYWFGIGDLRKPQAQCETLSCSGNVSEWCGAEDRRLVFALAVSSHAERVEMIVDNEMANSTERSAHV